MKKFRGNIFPVVISGIVLQFDRNASRTHIVLVRVIIPLLGNSQRCTSINVSERTEIQGIVCSSIRSPFVYIMATGRAVKVLQLSTGFPDICISVFCNAIYIGDTLGGIAAELQFFSILIQNGKVAAALIAVPFDCKVFILRVVYIINIAVSKINIAIYMEGKIAVLYIKGISNSLREPGLRSAERDEVFFLIIIIKESFIINGLPIIALHSDGVALYPIIIVASLGIGGVAIDCFFYYIVSKALAARSYIIKVVKGNSCCTVLLLEC